MAWDTQTLLLISTLVVGFLGLLQLWIWWQDRSLNAVGLWGCAHLCGATGIGLLLGRNTLPLWVSLDGANALLLLTYGIMWAGTRRLNDRPASPLVVVAGSIAWLVACQVPAFYDVLVARVAAISLVIGAFDLVLMREFITHRPGAETAARRLLAWFFGVHAVLQLVRIGIALAVGFDQSGHALPQSAAFAIPAVTGLLMAVANAVLLITLAKDEAKAEAFATLAEARDTAERANIAKSRFLARTSHELRTPLNGVLGMAQALARDPALGARQRARAVQLEEAGRHLLGLVNDILDLARAEAGRLEVTPRPVWLREMVDASVELVAQSATAAGITLDIDLAPDLPAAVDADPLRVRQIMINLLGNAVKFTPQGGRVSLSVARRAGQQGLCIRVVDTGPGVPADIEPYLFEDFMLGHAAHPSGEGTGMGLAISAMLAHAMRGTIAYAPGPGGRGAAFTVELDLPDADPALVEEAKAPAPTLGGCGRRVLVVDDVPTNRRLAQALLEQAGFTVELAASGPAALEALARGTPPAVVLMDVLMPDMDGLEATRRIRAMPGPVGRVPIIALTADAGAEQARACRAAGMDGTLPKPFAIDELLARIAEHAGVG